MKSVIALTVVIAALVALLLVVEFDGSHTTKAVNNTQCQLEHCPTF